MNCYQSKEAHSLMLSCGSMQSDIISVTNVISVTHIVYELHEAEVFAYLLLSCSSQNGQPESPGKRVGSVS